MIIRAKCLLFDFQQTTNSKRCKTDRKILMERPDGVAHIIRFLRHIKKLRDAGYNDET